MPVRTNSSTRTRTRGNVRRGFTLIELIVVVIIIAVLAAIGAVAYNQYAAKARSNAVLASASELRTALMAAAARDDHTAAVEAALLWGQAGGDKTAFLTALDAHYDGPVTFTAAGDSGPATLLVGSAGSGTHTACLVLTEPPTVLTGSCAEPAPPGNGSSPSPTGSGGTIGSTSGTGQTGAGSLVAGPTALAVTTLSASATMQTALTNTAAEGIAWGPDGDLYYANHTAQRVYKMDPVTDAVTLLAGTGTGGFSGDGGPATEAKLSGPRAVAVDAAGNVYIADYGNNRIRKIDAATGVISTFAGNGSAGTAGDGKLATDASVTVGYPQAVAGNPAGDLYIGSSVGGRLRKVDAATGIISTIAGNGLNGKDANDVAATSTPISAVTDLAVGPDGSVYLASNYTIRKVDPAGMIRAVAGTYGAYGYTGDGGPATAATLHSPGIFVDGTGDVYIADWQNYVVRYIDHTTGVITTIAGNGTSGQTGDGGPALDATLVASDIAVDAAGNYWLGLGPGAAVTNVRSVAVVASGSQKLTWAPEAGATGYTVYRDGTRIGTTAATTFVDGHTQPGHTYTYTVTATVSGKDTAPSAGVTVTV